MVERTLFSEEHEIFRQSVRRFMEREMAPHHEAWDCPLPDGTAVAFLGIDDPQREPQNAKVGVLDLATGAIQRLSAHIPWNVSGGSLTRDGQRLAPGGGCLPIAHEPVVRRHCCANDST